MAPALSPQHSVPTLVAHTDCCIVERSMTKPAKESGNGSGTNNEGKQAKPQVAAIGMWAGGRCRKATARCRFASASTGCGDARISVDPSTNMVHAPKKPRCKKKIQWTQYTPRANAREKWPMACAACSMWWRNFSRKQAEFFHPTLSLQTAGQGKKERCGSDCCRCEPYWAQPREGGRATQCGMGIEEKAR